MIQRIQSFWLFLAALFNSGVLYFALYKTSAQAGVGSAIIELRTADHYPSLLIAVVMIFLPLAAIFMFRNRKRQKSMVMVSMLAILSFISLLLARVSSLDKMTPPPTGGTYWVGAILPAVSLVFLFLALMGINKDDKLVKSMDRLR